MTELQNLRVFNFKTQPEYNLRATYSAENFSYSFAFSDLSSYLEILVDNTQDVIVETHEKDNLMGISFEVKKDIDQVKKIREAFSANINNLTKCYISIEEGSYDQKLKAIMKAKGLQKTVEFFAKKSNSLNLMYNVTNLNMYRVFFLYKKEAFQKIITRISDGLY